MQDNAKRYLLDRAKEPSTWRGIVVLLMGLGVGISPQMIDIIISFGASAAGLIGILTSDA